MRFCHLQFLAVPVCLILAGASGGCGRWKHHGADPATGTPDPAALTVSTTVPVDGATEVFLNTKVLANFGASLDATTVNAQSFTLMLGDQLATGTVSTLGTAATFKSDVNLAPNTTYQASLQTTIMDAAGHGLGVVKTWSFSTGTTTDTAVQTVSSTSVADGGSNVALGSALVASFGKAVDPLSVTPATFAVTQNGVAVAGNLVVVGNVVTFKPTAALAANTKYTVTLTDGIKDLAGNPLAGGKTWSFTTGSGADTTAPTLVSNDPADAATGVALNRSLAVTFSKAIDPASVTAKTFYVTSGPASVAGTVATAGSVASFKPSLNLAPNTLYTATLTTGVKDLAGNALAQTKSWTFTTGSSAAAGPAPVALGLAGSFAILTKTGITNVATSAITGNIGTSPITGASVVGLDCIQVVGKIYQVDAAGPACATTDATYLTTAIGDMQIAYTDSAGRTSPDATELGAGELGGLTVAPGLYKWGSNVHISTELKLSGGMNDVWIFQIAGDLTEASGIHVTLLGGALPQNIFWQVAGQVTLDTTAQFNGTILSQTQIALKTGASLTGRALAQTAVTLQSNSVHKP